MNREIKEKILEICDLSEAIMDEVGHQLSVLKAVRFSVSEGVLTDDEVICCLDKMYSSYQLIQDLATELYKDHLAEVRGFECE